MPDFQEKRPVRAICEDKVKGYGRESVPAEQGLFEGVFPKNRPVRHHYQEGGSNAQNEQAQKAEAVVLFNGIRQSCPQQAVPALYP